MFYNSSGTHFAIIFYNETQNNLTKEGIQMANKKLFGQTRGTLLPLADAKNEAGGSAYALQPEHALAQMSVTGCLNSVYYANAEQQLDKILSYATNVTPEFLAKTAVYSRKNGFMKDMPALLCAVLASKDTVLLKKVFNHVIDNGKMLRNFVQIVRSGVTGRKSLGSAPKRLIIEWLENQSDTSIFNASIGNEPSLADIIKMVHPLPTNKVREALYAYIIGKEYNQSDIPQIVKDYESFKKDMTSTIPDIPFQFLTSLDLPHNSWRTIARNASWQMTRMNLNTFLRHGVFEDRELTHIIAQRLKDPDAIRKAKVFPYQLLSAFKMTGGNIPVKVRNALQDALEIAIENVPVIEGKVYVCLDVSGSMRSPVTGCRKGATSNVQCIDVASLIAAAIVRKNPEAEVIPFSDDVMKVTINARDSVMTNARILSSLPSGGTCCSSPLVMLNKKRKDGDFIIMVSDNESWRESACGTSNKSTETMRQWSMFTSRNKHAKFACIDLQPYTSVQAKERHDILNIGGFSDSVFELLTLFNINQLSSGHWVDTINKVVL
jgi:60 kDa SS-A/Ro ribonucleoprotein